MKKKTLSRVLVIAGLAMTPIALTSSAYALSFVATQAAGEQSTSSIIGLRVENSSGDKLGDINYLVLDNSGKISTVVIGVGGFLGVGEKNVGVPYGELKFNDKDGHQIAVIDATKDSLTSAPNYVWTEKSAMQKIEDRAVDLTNKAKDAASGSGTSTNSGSSNGTAGAQ
jgi:sporulation protein YlmC with PRC-barrel domain